ncbi:MAG TPA: HAD family phosphatase [Granulicella sp.]|jgi:putative hydrolase of the HAD superfamily|nr:HAD family phosphatase [Granulicella sp.]
MSEIRAVLFDYGMVLSAPPLPSAWARMLAITGLDEARFQPSYWAPRHDYDRGTYTGQEYWLAVGEAAGLSLDPTQIAGLIAADNDLWTDLNRPMLAWAQQLQRAGVRTGILSNLGDEMAAGLLERFDWIEGFYHCTWSHALKLAKPEAAIYQHAAVGLETPLEHILFIDDREDNIAGAAQTGMQTIRYTTHAAFEQEMTARGLQALLHPHEGSDAPPEGSGAALP